MSNCSNCTATSTSIVAPTLCLSLSIIGILANSFLIMVISTDKKMKSPCFTLILGGGIGSLIMAMGYFLSGLGRLEVYPFTNQVRILCQIKSGILFKVVSIPFNSQVSFLISLDRLFGATMPIRYRARGKRYARFGLKLCTVYGILEFIGLVLAKPAYEVIPRCSDSVFLNGSLFGQVFAISNLTLCVLCVAGYVAMLFFIQLEKNKIYNLADRGDFMTIADKQLYMKQFNAVLPVVKLLLFLYFIFGVVPEILYSVINVLGAWTGISSTIAEELKVTSSLVEILSLSLRSQQFRDGARRIVRLGDEDDYQVANAIQMRQQQRGSAPG